MNKITLYTRTPNVAANLFAVVCWNGLDMAADIPDTYPSLLSKQDVAILVLEVLHANFKEHMWNRFEVNVGTYGNYRLYINGELVCSEIDIQATNSPRPEAN